MRKQISLEYVSEFKYLRRVLDESGTDKASVVGRWRMGGGLQVLLGLWLMRGVYSLNVLGSLLVPIFTYGSETMI